MKRKKLLWLLGGLLLGATVLAVAAACEDEEEEAATPTPTAAATEEATAAPTEVATEVTDTKAALIAQFPADAQEFLQDLPENLIQLLWEVRQEGPADLVWADAGGEFHEGQRRAGHEEWEKITGWTVFNAVQPGCGIPENLKVAVEAGNPEWDVTSVCLSNGILQTREGLLENLDLSYFNEELYPPTSPWSDTFMDFEDGDTLLVWNTDVFGEPGSPTAPTSFFDIFDTEKFPGKRCVFSFVDSGMLEWALLFDGVPFDQVYDVLATDEGLQRALAKIDTIRDDIVWIESGAESTQFILDGQCDLGTTWNGRPALRVRDEPDLPLAVTHQDAIIWNEAFAIPKGAPHYKAALSALAYFTQPRNECDFLNILAYGIVMDVPPFPDCISDFVRVWGPDPALAAGSYDAEFYADNIDRLTEAWTAWQTG